TPVAKQTCTSPFASESCCRPAPSKSLAFRCGNPVGGSMPMAQNIGLRCPSAFELRQSARGLAHSKTLPRGPQAPHLGGAFGLRQSSGAFTTCPQTKKHRGVWSTVAFSFMNSGVIHTLETKQSL